METEFAMKMENNTRLFITTKLSWTLTKVKGNVLNDPSHQKCTKHATKHPNIVCNMSYHIINWFELYSLRPKLYDVLSISHILRDAINIVWKRDIMSYFTKSSLINNMGKINERIERRKSNKYLRL
jgi:hypothetical protein